MVARILVMSLFLAGLSASAAAAGWKWYAKPEIDKSWQFQGDLGDSLNKAKSHAIERCMHRYEWSPHKFPHAQKIVSADGSEIVFNCADERKKAGVEQEPVGTLHGKPLW